MLNMHSICKPTMAGFANSVSLEYIITLSVHMLNAEKKLNAFPVKNSVYMDKTPIA